LFILGFEVTNFEQQAYREKSKGFTRSETFTCIIIIIELLHVDNQVMSLRVSALGGCIEK